MSDTHDGSYADPRKPERLLGGKTVRKESQGIAVELQALAPWRVTDVATLSKGDQRRSIYAAAR
jgi:hypothetical protein